MDADYGRNLERDGAPTKAFEPSLFVWATVMSRPTEDRAVQAVARSRTSAVTGVVRAACAGAPA
jgi:hypothetical protein